MVLAQDVDIQSETARHDVGAVYTNEGNGNQYIYGHADGAIVSGDYVIVDGFSHEAKKCQGNGLSMKSGALCVARCAYTDNYYGWFQVVQKGIYEGFRKGGVCTGTTNTGLPTGTAGDENVLITADGNAFEYHILGTQTILYPTWTLGTGINMLFDATADDGWELTNGIRAADPLAFVVGQDGAFHFKIKFSVADVSGTDDCAVGFRKAEAYQGAIDNYDEMAAFNIITAVINTETILNNDTTVTTDTTETDVVDGEAHTYGIFVAADGAVTYTYDGSEPTAVVDFSFDDGEVVVPFFFFLSNTTPSNCIITDWEVGLD